jgi:hypothetical protein
MSGDFSLTFMTVLQVQIPTGNNLRGLKYLKKNVKKGNPSDTPEV